MTDLTVESGMPASDRRSIHTNSAARSRLSKRYAAEARFKYTGLAAVLTAICFLLLLLSTVIGQAISAFSYHYVSIEIDIPKIESTKIGAALRKDLLKVDFNGLLKTAVRSEFAGVTGRRDKRKLNGLLSSASGSDLRNHVVDNPSLAGTTASIPFLLSDFGDLYLKGEITDTETVDGTGTATLAESGKELEIASNTDDFAALFAAVKQDHVAKAGVLRKEFVRLGDIEDILVGRISEMATAIAEASDEDRGRYTEQQTALEDNLESIRANRERIDGKAKVLEERALTTEGWDQLATDQPSYLVRINGGTVKVLEVDKSSIKGKVLMPLTSLDQATAGTWAVDKLTVPEDNRKLSDQEIAWVDHLAAQGVVERRFNSVFFTAGASREPEQAGLWGAVVGTFFTMIVTLLLSFPIGVAAAVYLEEFAPKNRYTDMIEVNINNLAAVPSIVFGLLGLAVFLNFFGFPRSAPLVGGMVLALMTLPTIIIASRAALKAVPPSIREAALGIGASRIQAVFHHVLPLALPGIMTGTIIGMAQALGETAPLLMIGMVAFIVDIPGGPMDPATVLPVQIFMWADFPEPAFRQKTAAAILVLLGFLITMNLLAVMVRRRFERRW